jgi:hypothetical protein
MPILTKCGRVEVESCHGRYPPSGQRGWMRSIRTPIFSSLNQKQFPPATNRDRTDQLRRGLDLPPCSGGFSVIHEAAAGYDGKIERAGSHSPMSLRAGPRQGLAEIGLTPSVAKMSWSIQTRKRHSRHATACPIALLNHQPQVLDSAMRAGTSLGCP